MSEEHRRGGLAAGLAAYFCWGLIPLYFKAVAHVGPVEVLAHRIVWSCVFLGLVVAAMRRTTHLAHALRNRSVRRTLCATTLLIGVNWFVYIYSVVTGQVLQSSLGYFITPLANVLLGIVVLGERLRRLQGISVAIAALGVAILIVARGELPWIALALAASFSTYALLRKTVAIDGLLGLWTETALLLPPSLAAIALHAVFGATRFGDDLETAFLLMAGGLVTSVPLLLFTFAARRLSLSTLGVLQYLSPSIQFALAATLFGERVSPADLACFGCIWAALAIYTADALRRRPRLRAVAASSDFEPTTPTEAAERP